MSNFHALGFRVATRDEAAALARVPLRRSPAQLRLHERGAVHVHRFEVGDGIELWSVRQGPSLVASYPTFQARSTRRAVVERITFPHTPYTPRVWLAGRPPLAVQLVNWLFVPADALAPGTPVRVAIAGLAAHGVAPSDGAPGAAPEPGAAENHFRLTGDVTASEAFANRLTGAPLRWLALDLGPAGSLEVVCAAGEAEGVAVGQRVTSVATLRATVVAIGADADAAGSEDA